MRMDAMDCLTQATPQEIEARQRQLKAVRDAATTDLKQRTAPLPAYFKVPFTEALDLVCLIFEALWLSLACCVLNKRMHLYASQVGTRRVYLEAGVAFVPFENVVSILFSAFRANVGFISSTPTVFFRARAHASRCFVL